MGKLVSWRNKAQIIAEHYGFESQREQLIEELSELILAAQKVKRVKREIEASGMTEARRERFSEAQDNFIEELADVEIMIEQISYLLDKNRFKAKIESKVERQIARMKTK